jgi:predicted nuclease of predicted toxin-antitoxin system
MAWVPLEQPTEDELRNFKARYRGKARFLVDESAGVEVCRLLKNNGYNAKFVKENDLRGRSDEDVFAAAWSEGRIVVTHDTDFLDNTRFPSHRNPGVILIRPGADGRDDQGLIQCLAKALLIAGDNASWFQGKKLEFSSEEIGISSGGNTTRERFLWRRHGRVMKWID